ncbi:MAG: HAD-IIB family hydrolase [Halobacteriovoraceae bacterium]|nr:HAD-IIB family hydrolase [Halobacteriovoraceae bacterium]
MELKLVFSDFDGTLTHGQELTPVFFDVLDLLTKKKIPLIIVTGRSKSWAHFFLTHIENIPYVISEGGGVISSKNHIAGRNLLSDHLMVPEIEVRRLEHFTEALKKRFPDILLSVDSFGRHTDRAIELSYLEANEERAQSIKEFLELENINYSCSNVHLNYWCGDISKYTAVKHLLVNTLKIDEESCIYFGDAPNDQTMFEHFDNSVGVSNLKEFEAQLSYKPSIILEGHQNEGPSGVFNHLTSILK